MNATPIVFAEDAVPPFARMAKHHSKRKKKRHISLILK
jgi:hypothetical protein